MYPGDPNQGGPHGPQGRPPAGPPPPFPPPPFPPPQFSAPPQKSNTGLIVGLVLGGVVLLLLLISIPVIILIAAGSGDDEKTSSATASTTYPSAGGGYSPAPYPSTETTTPDDTAPYVPPPPPIDYFGAIAISYDTGKVGIAYNARSREVAESGAISKCAASDCAARIWFLNSCGAAVQNPSSLQWGWAQGTSRQEAIDKAAAFVSGESRVITAVCTANAS